MALFGRSRGAQSAVDAFGLSIESSPTDKEMAKHFDRLHKDVRDFRGAFRQIAKRVTTPAVKEAFASRRAPGGRRWRPLSRTYRDRKRNELKGDPRKILELSGALKKAMTRAKSEDGIRDFKRLRYAWGTFLPYAVPLQWGYGLGNVSVAKSKKRSVKERHRGRRNVSGRPMVEMTPEMQAEAAAIFHEKLEDLTANEAKILAARRARQARR